MFYKQRPIYLGGARRRMPFDTARFEIFKPLLMERLLELNSEIEHVHAAQRELTRPASGSAIMNGQPPAQRDLSLMQPLKDRSAAAHMTLSLVQQAISKLVQSYGADAIEAEGVARLMQQDAKKQVQIPQSQVIGK